MDKITITEERTDDKGRYVARVNGHEEIGIMTYSRVSDVLIIVNHTEVPLDMNGRKKPRICLKGRSIVRV